MAQAKLEAKGSPTGVARWLYRAPIWLYRAHLGFVMGHRFVMIEHIGRKSGKKRQTVLEVVAEEDDAVYLAAAWGSKAQWLQNVRANPEVTVHLGKFRFESNAQVLEKEEAFRVLSEYSVAHPKTLRGLTRFMLDDPGETTEDLVKNVSDLVPFVRLSKTSV
jgi:deazaflavin-dependent oxidoreductase (nitroreductase family)